MFMRHGCSAWAIPPDTPALSKAEVHVWRAAIAEVCPLHLQGLERILSAGEKDRAGRFHFQKDRDQFVAARGLLRRILGRYLSEEPRRLRFRYGPAGKPALAGEFGDDAVRFNLAHSGGLFLFAMTQGREVGIDLEHLSRDFPVEEISARFLAPQEGEALRALPAERRPEAFFRCWTRKEAFIKAKGDGFSQRLDQFVVSVASGVDNALVGTTWDPQEVSRWSLQDLDLGADYLAALAVEGSDWRLRCWQWPDYSELQRQADSLRV